MQEEINSAKSKGGETESVARACRLLAALENADQALRLRDLVEHTGIGKATAFRILGTLVRHGLITKSANEYRVAVQRVTPRNVRIGYAAQSDEFVFARAVTDGIVAAAAKAGVELVMLNNAYSPVMALQNAETFIKEEVHLVMEFQTDSSIASLISARLIEKRMPLIAIEIPHPNATYFGANNTQAGLIAGRYLGRWAKANWKGKVDDVVLLSLPMAGPLPGSRLTGSLLGIRDILPFIEDRQVSTLSGNGQFIASYDAVKQYLKKNKHKRILVSAINDPSALGALKAFREMGRQQHCVIVGQNATSEAILEMSHVNTRLIGSVGYFPEKYGEQLIPIALQLLAHKQIPSAIFIKHHLITPHNVHEYYSVAKKAVLHKQQS